VTTRRRFSERHPQHHDTCKSNLQPFAKMNARALYLLGLALLIEETIGACSQHQPGTCSVELTASLGPAGGQIYICKVFDHTCNEMAIPRLLVILDNQSTANWPTRWSLRGRQHATSLSDHVQNAP